MCYDLVENPKNIKLTWVGTNEKGLQILQEQAVLRLLWAEAGG